MKKKKTIQTPRPKAATERFCKCGKRAEFFNPITQDACGAHNTHKAALKLKI